MRTKYKFTLSDVEALEEIGVIKPDERVELIRGNLYDVPPPSSQHAAWVDKVARALEKACNDEVILRVQSPIHLDEHNAPKPDISILKYQADFYETELPGPTAVLLAVEVSLSTLQHDRDKLTAYAEAGVPEVWLVDLAERWLEVYLQPLDSKHRYRSRTLYNFDEAMTPTFIPSVQEVVF